MYVKYEQKNLPRVVCNGRNVFAHLLCCDRSYLNLRVPCRFCSPLWVGDAKFICEAVTYHFDRVYTDNLFSFHVEQLFSLCKKMYFFVMYLGSQKYNSDVVSVWANRCMNVSLAKNSAEIIEFCLEVLVRLLLSGLVHVANRFYVIDQFKDIVPNVIFSPENERVYTDLAACCVNFYDFW